MSLARLRIGIIAAVAVLLIPLAVSAAQEDARKSVDQFHADLIAVMKDAASLGYAGRFDKIGPSVRRVFDLPLLSRAVTGYAWDRFTDQQKAAVVDAFTRLTIANYASRFDSYGGEKFEYVDVQQGPSQTLLVKTSIAKPKGKPTSLNYLMRETSGKWVVIDVFFKSGISEVATRRSEFSSVLQREGVEGFIAALIKKADSLQFNKPE